MKRKLAPGQTRRPHTKSRGGCTTCKKRKVKCTEERPTCLACFQRKTPCAYLDPTLSSASIHATRPNPLYKSATDLPPTRRMLPLPSTPDSPSDLNLTDLRLLHHFLTTCYPHLPAGNESIWTTEIPIIASQRPYLMHALLGLAATHLHLLSQQQQQHTNHTHGNASSPPPPSTNSAAKAIHHRTHALAGLHGALQQAPPLEPTSSYSSPPQPPPSPASAPTTTTKWSKTHADALLACAYALTFQATYMPDGLDEFVTMVRGCALITRQIAEKGYVSSFDLRPGMHVDVLEGFWESKGKRFGIGGVDEGWLGRGREGMRVVRGRVGSNEGESDGEVEGRFLRAVEEVVDALGLGLKDGYVAFCEGYGVWFDCDGVEFGRLVDKGNECCRMLMAWFLGLELLLSPVFGGQYASEKRRRDVIGLRVLCACGWVRGIEEGLSERVKGLVGWPMEVARAVWQRARRWVVEGGREEEFLRCEVWIRISDESASEHARDCGRGRNGAGRDAEDLVYPTPEEL